MSDVTKSPTLCPLPWLHRFVNLDGTVQVCCTSEDVPGHVVLRDDGTPFRIGDGASDEEIMNSQYMRTLKKQMLDGEWPAICSRCEMDEELGSISRRQAEMQGNEKRFLKLLEQTGDDGMSPPEISFYDFRLGNTCNLKCRMCSPYASSKLLSDYHLIQGEPVSEEDRKRYRSFTWPSNPASWELLLQNLANVDYLHFAGGEPIIIPQMIQALERCVEAGEAHHITLSYNTNITRITPDMRRLWPHFKGIKLRTSIDAVVALNAYIRHPAVWEDIHDNMRDVDSSAAEYNCEIITVHSTVLIYNVLYLDRLFEYLATSFANVRPAPCLVRLRLPPFFDVRILPESYRQRAIERLERAKQTYADVWRPYPDATMSVDAIIHLLQEEIENRDALIEQFKRVTRDLDQHRKESLFEVAPEVAEAFDLRPARRSRSLPTTEISSPAPA